MSHLLTLIPDCFEFVRVGGELSGQVDMRGSPRFADLVCSEAAASVVHYRVRGILHEGKPFLEVAASGRLMLSCQRCLGVLEYDVDTVGRLLLVEPGQPLPDDELEEDAFDAVHAVRNFDVVEAVEEELLLALPLAPMHVDCGVPTAKQVGDVKKSPFAGLENLRIQGKGDGKN